MVSLGMFLRPNLLGYDSYATWSAVRYGAMIDGQPLANLVWGLLPDSLLLFKLLMVVSLFFCLWACLKISEHFFDERIAWLSIVALVGLGPLLLFEFAKFENELFAWPFILWGIYFLLKRDWEFSVTFFGVSLGFWVWPYYFFVWKSGNALEQQFLSGVLPLFGLLFVIPFVFLYRDRWVKVLGCVFLFFCLVSPKTWVFFVPFLLVGIGELIAFLEFKQYDVKKLLPAVFILIICWNVAIFLSPPSVQELEIVGSAVGMAKDENILLYNDWSFGHWIYFSGYNTWYRGWTGNPDYNQLVFDGNKFVAVSDSNLATLGCEWQDGTSTSTRSINLWKCN